MDKIRDLAIVEEKAYQIRQQLHLTQKEFGKLIGISKTYLSDMENGYRKMSIHHINKVCNIANVSFDYMFGFSKEINQDIIKIDHINLKILGSHLKEIRKDLNYTQEKMAKSLNISQSFFSFCESGKKAINTDELKQICENYGYSADWCIGKLNYCLKYKPMKKLKTKEMKELIKA